MPDYGLPNIPRPYICTACSSQKQISTNHTDSCYDYCVDCSHKANWAPSMMMNGRHYRKFKHYNGPMTEHQP